MTTRRVVSCPRCGTPRRWEHRQSASGPFCSERCKMIDLGAWASEKLPHARSVEDERRPRTNDVPGAAATRPLN